MRHTTRTRQLALIIGDDPAEVARQGFEALMNGKSNVVAESASSRLLMMANRVLPDSVTALGNRLMARPIRRRRIPTGGP